MEKELARLKAENARYRDALLYIGHFDNDYLMMLTKGTTLHIDMAGVAQAALKGEARQSMSEDSFNKVAAQFGIVRGEDE